MNVATRLKFLPYDANFSWKIFFSHSAHGRVCFNSSSSAFGSSTSALRFAVNAPKRASSGSKICAGSFTSVFRRSRA